MNTGGPVRRLYTMAALVLAIGSARAADAPAPAASPTRFAGATALLIEPENSYYGYDATIHAALLGRGFDVVPAQADALTEAAKLQPYDLIVTDLRRSFTPPQVAGLKAYLAAGGALYANWGGPMGTPDLLRVFGAKNAQSVYIRELTLPASPLTTGYGEQRWVFPEFSGHARLGEQGHEMVAFERIDGTEAARDATGHCLGILRQEGAGRCALLGFCPSNYRFLTDDGRLAGAVLDNLLTWLLPGGSKPHALPATFRVNLPRGAKLTSVSQDGRPLARPEVRTIGSLTSLTVPVGALAEGQTTALRVACTLPTGRKVETWIHDPVASSFNCFAPAEAAAFLAALHTNVVQPLLRYEGGSVCYLKGIAGDKPRERFAKYEGDLLAEYTKACHAQGIKVIGGLYLDWKRFEQHLSAAPPYQAKGQTPPEPKLGQAVCPLDPGVQQHNVAIVRNLLDHYPELDGLILDDNFEFDQRPCYCAACLSRFAAYCQRQGGAQIDPAAQAQAGGETWKAFWRAEKLAFCRQIHDLCAARGKPVGGWTAQRGPLAFKGVFDFAGNMVYVEPPGSVAPLWPLTGDFPVVTLLWGMNRQPAAMEADVVEAIRAGSPTVGFWICYAREEGVTDNPWSLASRPKGHFALTPGTLTAIQRSFSGVEQAWRDYYRDNLIQGDARLVVTSAKLDRQGLSVTIKRLPQPSPMRIMGPVDLSGLPSPTQ